MGSSLPQAVDGEGQSVWSFPLGELSSPSTWVKIGEGSFGNVYKASLLGCPVAVKENASSKENRVLGLRRDIAYLSSFPHPNIVQVLGAFELRDKRLYVVMEFVAHSLRTRRVVNRVDLVSVLADVARALVRLHGAGHIHRDVKARNVLVTADFRVAKLADFGLARPLLRPGREEEARAAAGGMTPRVGPRKYRAPEVEAGQAYAQPCDMYSYGVMVRELLDQLRRSTARRYSTATIDMLGALGSCCRRSRPEARPSAMEALQLLQQHMGRPLAAREGGSSRHRLTAPQGGLAQRLRPQGGRGGAEAPQPAAGDKRRRSESRSRSRSRSRSGESTSGGLIRLAGQPRKEWHAHSSSSSSSDGSD